MLGGLHWFEDSHNNIITYLWGTSNLYSVVILIFNIDAKFYSFFVVDTKFGRNADTTIIVLLLLIH